MKNTILIFSKKKKKENNYKLTIKMFFHEKAMRRVIIDSEGKKRSIDFVPVV